MMLPIVIVGAGQVGARAAHALRDGGWSGGIVMIGAEKYLPYERPPLSKGFLTGGLPLDTFTIYPEAVFADLGIDLRLGVSAVALDPAARRVTLSDGGALVYHRLLLATGAEPRRLAIPGSDLAGIRYLRTIDDARRLNSDIGEGRRLVIVGGGLIGLEVAASAVKRGTKVTVLEGQTRLMARVVPAEIAAVAAARHRAAGVDVRLGCLSAAFVGKNTVEAIRFGDGSVISCDAVLVAVGADPRVDIAKSAGLRVDNGIIVDETLRTDDPFIFAAGDVCAFHHDFFGRRMRLEHWKNAEDQGRLVARNMLGERAPVSAVPRFWSDQYELTIQVAGFHDLGGIHVVRHLGAETIVVFHLDAAGRVVGTSGIGPGSSIGRDVRIGQMMIEKRIRPRLDGLADVSVDLKSLLREEVA